MTTHVDDMLATLDAIAPAGGVWQGLNDSQPTVYPYLVVSTIPTEPNVALGGASALQPTRWQIDIYAATWAAAYALRPILRTAVESTFATATRGPSWADRDPDTRAHRIVNEWSIWASN